MYLTSHTSKILEAVERMQGDLNMLEGLANFTSDDRLKALADLARTKKIVSELLDQIRQQ